MAAKIDFELLQRAYFQWDKPVEYRIDEENIIKIYPISLIDSEIFLASVDIISIDKDSIADPKIISMSYLEFLLDYIIMGNQVNSDKFLNILRLCLHYEDMKIMTDDFGKKYLMTMDDKIKITAKKFNDIRRIILYQNIVGYDDGYVNPELKQAMAETDALKNHGIDLPSTERKMAIISAHSGITKAQQIGMSLREFTMLFNEVTGEVEHITTWPIALYAGKTNEMSHWIYRKSKGKLDGYVTDRNTLISKVGGDPNNIAKSDENNLDNIYDNFSK